MEADQRTAVFRRSAAVAILAIAALAGCATNEKRYASFADVPYDYPNEREVWSPRAGLRVHIAELNPTGSETLVLLHPWMTNMLVWHDVAGELAKDRRVVLIDLPGHGKSAKPYGAYSLPRLAYAVLDVLDALHLKSPIVAGNSLGGATSIEVARLAPGRVAGIILIGSPGGLEISEPLRKLVHSSSHARQLNSLTNASYFIGFLAIARRMSPLAERMYDDLVALRDSPEFPLWAHSTSSAMAEVVTYAPALEKIETRALVLQGTQDLVVPFESGEAIAHRMKNAKFEALGGCGHVPELECPALLISRMKDWLRTDQALSSVMSSSVKPSK